MPPPLPPTHTPIPNYIAERVTSQSELRGCVKVEMAVLVSPSLTVLNVVSVDVNQLNRVPGEIKRREVELDPQASPEEIMSREVELPSS